MKWSGVGEWSKVERSRVEWMGGEEKRRRKNRDRRRVRKGFWRMV